eukprot:CAMPEP_0195529382 /NCGR_PEP_ID=MMETSP0794_2-20130614/31891_1 /TAXON_ID=515487 /ORGANISM="Stephanopyxis turris, Strain CCMP 815" /LENGTH=644 /DNA_ID=CAMNT_0040660677 /DNA_START=19 /DNA_END=1953 /DNA_ORIENTATION=+
MSSSQTNHLRARRLGRTRAVSILLSSSVLSSPTTAFQYQPHASLCKSRIPALRDVRIKSILKDEDTITNQESSSSARVLLDQVMQIRRDRLKQRDTASSPSFLHSNNLSNVLMNSNTESTWENLFSATSGVSSSTSLNDELLALSTDETTQLSSMENNDDTEDSDELSIVNRVKEQNIASLNAAVERGSDVPDIELQLQMEAARKRSLSNNGQTKSLGFGRKTNSHVQADALIEQMTASDDDDTTSVEKMAMKAIPMQLPAPATKALSAATETDEKVKAKKQVSSRTVKTTDSSATTRIPTTKTKSITKRRNTSNKNKSNGLNRSSTGRITPEEEIELAHLIQAGSRIQTLKTEYEAKHKCSITRAEWAELAGLSTSELRRLVSDYRNSKSKLVCANMGLVHAVVRNTYRTDIKGADHKVSQEELIQEGSLGLLRAAELFDPNRGLRFSTYATIWIKGVLSNNKLEESIVIPIRERNKWNKVSRAAKDYSDEHGGKKATIEELAEMCGLTVVNVETLLDKVPKARKILSLDYKYSSMSKSGGTENDNGTLYGDKAFLAEADLAETMQMKADVVAALARNLDPREARLMRLRYGLKDGTMRSIAECARSMGISNSRAQQLAAGCLKKLRQADDAKTLQEYLLTVA